MPHHETKSSRSARRPVGRVSGLVAAVGAPALCAAACSSSTPAAAPVDSGTTATTDAGPTFDAALATTQVIQTNLVSDESTSGAAHSDPNLVNAWGLAFNPAGPIWVSDNGTGKATVYDATGAVQPVVVTVPLPAAAPASDAGAADAGVADAGPSDSGPYDSGAGDSGVIATASRVAAPRGSSSTAPPTSPGTSSSSRRPTARSSAGRAGPPRPCASTARRAERASPA